ncbi:END3 (YNL084C) [Zygosaccharomyces parabailii]|nr:END3 (YNL084C) [Zygosaccharomyces parabailii]CDH08566.1 related to Actin cytoskeleton-regulatory complex protein END3 [Zygosaccharomyces bailii ISA1307]
MPKLEQFEIKKYWQIFSGLRPEDNKVSHDQVLPILFNSKLDSSILNKIWFLADIDDDDSLDFEEFVICMRLIFDMVNKNISSVPDELPDWLVPGSKTAMIKERRQRKQREEADMPTNKPPEVDWYMAPEDLKLYEKLLDSCERLTDGTVTFPSLSQVIRSKFFNVGTSDLNKMWSLVNPKNKPSIDKDPAFYFVHCLRQCNDVGARIPNELPRALKDICNKERVSYDLKSHQGNLKKSDTPNGDDVGNYKTSYSGNGTNISSEQEISALQAELAQLDSELNAVTAEASRLPVENTPGIVRKQLEGLLRFKRERLQQTNDRSRTAQPVNSNTVRDDMDSIEEQITVLESYLENKKQELQVLRSEIQSTR